MSNKINKLCTGINNHAGQGGMSFLRRGELTQECCQTAHTQAKEKLI